MNTKGIADIVQILTGLALVGGLVLVLWEMQQARDVAMAQLTSDGYTMQSNILAAQMGEDWPIAFEKACADSEALSLRELAVLQESYYANLDGAMRIFSIEERTELYRGIWQDIARGQLRIIFGTSAGRNWWQLSRDNPYFPMELQQLGDSLLEEALESPKPCSLIQWQEQMRSSARTIPNL